MNLPKASVGHPIFTTMVTLMVIVIGAVCLSRLRTDMLPDIELPTVTISTEYPGASPEVMERLVTQIIEEIVGTVPGVEDITSESSDGNSSVRVTFTWGTDIDTAALDVQSRIADEIDELPEDALRPRVRKFDIDSFPIVILGVASKLDPVELTQIVEAEVRLRFSRVPGVAQVDVWGGFAREIRVGVDPDRIRAIGLPLSQVLSAIRNANLDLPAGKIEDGQYEVTLRAPAEFKDLDEIRNTVVLNRDSGVVTLGQIATVEDTYEKLTRIVRVNGERGIRVAVRKQADANTVEVSKRVLDEIEKVNVALPLLKITAVSNQGNFIERSIANVTQSVLYGGALAIIVLLIFLRSIRSTFVIALAIPISVIATFALVYFGGLTINLMTLGGLALGVGMMVDSSVVVLENIFRRKQEEGEDSTLASIEGAREVAPAIIASTITTLVIFLPLVFVRGVTGILFQDLAYVIMFSLICSLLVALSLVPMLASKLLKNSGHTPRTGFINHLKSVGDRFFGGMDNAYRDLLRLVLRFRLLTILLSASLLLGSVMLLPMIGSEFLPPSDEGEVRVTGKMEIGTRLDLVDQQTRKMEEIINRIATDMRSSVVSVGASGRNPNAASEGEVQISLAPLNSRTRSNVEIAAELRRNLASKIPGMEVRTRAPQGQFLIERVLGGEEGITVEVRGFDLAVLNELSRRVAEDIKDVPGIVDVLLTNDAGIPQQELRIDRDRVADMNLSVRDVTEVLETAVAGTRAGEFRTGGDSYRILVQLKDAEKRSVDEILDITLSNDAGDQVALRNVVEAESGRGPILITRTDQQRLMRVQANVAGRDLGSVAKDVQARLDRIPQPANYNLVVAGAFEEQQKAFGELMISLLLALALVYMVLACQYESFRDPFIVMFSVPLAAVGVFVTLFVTNTTFNVQSYIGCIMLGGIVVNNAILIVDQAARLERGGLLIHDALAEAGRRRLRPILMTTLTTILALVPLAMGIGEGADAQAPLARTVVGGLAGSSLITLLLIPALYSVFHRGGRKIA
jgi:HAE1 family hydrophobic/amphiphilic exporter-1